MSYGLCESVLPRTIGLAECDVTDSEGRLIARALSTCMTLRGESGESR